MLILDFPESESSHPLIMLPRRRSSSLWVLSSLTLRPPLCKLVYFFFLPFPPSSVASIHAWSHFPASEGRPYFVILSYKQAFLDSIQAHFLSSSFLKTFPSCSSNFECLTVEVYVVTWYRNYNSSAFPPFLLHQAHRAPITDIYLVVKMTSFSHLPVLFVTFYKVVTPPCWKPGRRISKILDWSFLSMPHFLNWKFEHCFVFFFYLEFHIFNILITDILLVFFFSIL